MTDALRVLLEVGRKRRVVAGAMDWPGLDRWGTSEEDAIEKLSSYIPRYAGVAERAGLAAAFARAGDIDVVERVPGSSSTDFWGVAHVPSQIEREILPAADLERRLVLLQATWARFDEVAAQVSPELRPGARSAGRSRDQIIRHVYLNEPDQFSRKIEVRTPFDVVMTPDGLVAHRRAYLDAIRAYNAEGRPARSWPIQFLIRRTAHHVMDHAWEMEDRDLSSPRPDDIPLEEPTLTDPQHHTHEHEHHHTLLAYPDAVRAFRADKDEFFRTRPGSPIPEGERAAFTGLPYYPVDEAYGFEGLTLEPYAGDEPTSFAIPTSDGQLRPAERAGTLRFAVGGVPHALTAYSFEHDHSGAVFVPFIDGTSGTETYGAGRYLDIEPDDDGTYTLDFNLAYHPSCVYDPKYSCPLTPAENRLPVRIEAGERLAPTG